MVNIWVDADACPATIKDLLFRASRRLSIPIYVVANSDMYVPDSPLATLVRVAKGPDVADQHIIDHVVPNDLVITADIPLAAAVVDKEALAINPRGEVYTAENVYDRLAMRNLMQDLRDGGVVRGGPASLNATDRQTFASALDRSLTKLLKST